MLFTVSAIYHRGTWSPHVHDFLRRFDHANIFVLIAGSCTPFALLLLEGAERSGSCSASSGRGALAGVAFRVLWAGAPRWLYAPIYIAPRLGAGLLLRRLRRGAGPARIGTAVLVLVIVGGALYTLGAVVYGFQLPDPSPRWFGFHEVFHTLTILAFVSHYVGVSLATYSLR